MRIEKSDTRVSEKVQKLIPTYSKINAIV